MRETAMNGTTPARAATAWRPTARVRRPRTGSASLRSGGGGVAEAPAPEVASSAAGAGPGSGGCDFT